MQTSSQRKKKGSRMPELSPRSECRLLTINLQQAVQEAVSFVLQSIVGSQRHGKVTIGLFITYKHLDICKKQRMQMLCHSDVTTCTLRTNVYHFGLKLLIVKYLPSEQSRQTQWCHQKPSCILGVAGERPAAWMPLSWGRSGRWSGPWELQNSPCATASSSVCRQGCAYSNPEEAELIQEDVLNHPKPFQHTWHTQACTANHQPSTWEVIPHQKFE